MTMNLEYHPDPAGRPEFIPFVPSIRDLAWERLYNKSKGRIDERFAFIAFRTAPLVSTSTMDAKVATADMANRLMVWAEFGRPNESVWSAGNRNGGQNPNRGLYPGGYHLFRAAPDESLVTAVRENEKARLAAKPKNEPKPVQEAAFKDRLWKGWILPASEADTWFRRRFRGISPRPAGSRRGEVVGSGAHRVPRIATFGGQSHEPIP
jgi:hypothetical protein